MLEHLGILSCAFLAALVLTPAVRNLAVRFGIVDQPDARRKLHTRVVARAGGTAVLGSVLLVCAIGLLTFDFEAIASPDYYRPFLGLFAAMVGIWLLGLADDIFTLRGRQKLLVQVLIAGLLISCGFRIDHIQIFGYEAHLGLMSFPVSLVWLLATTNALNLIDGADGLCSTLGAIICGALGFLAYVNGHFAEAVISFAMCGALLGFLVYNFPPASIFLGDSGSLLIGMVTGALAIRCSLKGPTAVSFLAPLAILFLPLLDSAMAILRRKLTGRSIYTTDRAHLHHTLRGKGLSDRSLLAVVAMLSLITASGALAGQALGRDWIAPITVLVIFSMLVVTKAFGYAELILLARRGRHFAMSMLEPAKKTDKITRHKAIHLQGSRQWQSVWEVVVDFAETEGLCKVNLDLNVPWLEEGFHGTWHRARQLDRLERWNLGVPIRAQGRNAGRIEVTGPGNHSESLASITRLAEFVDSLQPQIESLMDRPAISVAVADPKSGPQEIQDTSVISDSDSRELEAAAS